jgi:hypothetical protein
MGAAVGLREDFGADELRRLAAKVKDAAQARRLLALDGKCTFACVRIGTILHPAVCLVFPDRASFVQHRNRPASRCLDRRPLVARC